MSTENIIKSNENKLGSGMAIVSIVMGLISVICFGLTLMIPSMIFIIPGTTSTFFEVMDITAPACLGFGILAVIFSLISLNKIRKGRQCGKIIAIVGLVTGIVVNYILISLPIPSAREPSRRISCASNLKQIGLAIHMYSQENNNQFPDKSGAIGFEMLRSGGYLENVPIYTCPSTGTKLLNDNPLTEAVDYVYIGGYNKSTSPDTVIAYDKPMNHYKYGNILFADGHVKGFVGANWMDKRKK
jgi:prepilin-type processing-associated H-X9-DG protein